MLYLSDIDDQTLIIMCIHESGGANKFKKQLGKSGVPKELKALNITLNDMYNEDALYGDKAPFIFIGRKGRKDSYFTILNKKTRKGPIMARQIISPYIPKNRLKKIVDVSSIPFYEGIISQVLERHLDIFVGEEGKKLQKVLGSVFNEETMSKLEEKKNWLSSINKMPITSKSLPHFDSILRIDKTMKSSITACMKISNGKPLLELLRKYAQMLQEYASILLKLINESGGNKLKKKLNTTDNKTDNLLKLADIDGDENKKENKKLKLKEIFTNNNTNNMIWTEEQIQFFVIYCCMVYNTCSKSRDLINELIKIGKNDLQKKYQNGCKNDLIETKELYLSIEEQCLQLIRAAIMDKFESIFEFEKHNDWQLDRYKKELTISFDKYLTNCCKLLTPSSLQHFYKVFIAHFSLRLFDRILNSNTLNSSSSSLLIDFPPIFESVVLKKVPSRIIKKMQIYINRCLDPVVKLIQLAYANGGEKYTKLQTIKNDKDNNKNIFSKFFGGGNKNNKNNKKDTLILTSIDTDTQMRTRQKTAIENTVFATQSVQFYTDNNISLNILNNIPSYKELFADDDELNNININAINHALTDLNDIKNIDNDIKDDSDSSLPDLTNNDTNNTEIIVPIGDNDYFGTTTITTSVSGFAVKKNKKKTSY